MKDSDPLSPEGAWKLRRSGENLVRAKAEYRDSFDRDRARVIHSAAFRRLQAKTQVLGIGEGDFHRTRLTHSLETAQIAGGIVRILKATNSNGELAEWLPNQNLIETIALCHDLGHPPFGHGGEVALNFAMRDAGGFEGNGQTLRLLARLEAHTEAFGLDLTRRSLLGVLKYPASYKQVVRLKQCRRPSSIIELRRDDWKPPKCYLSTEEDVVEWVLAPLDSPDRSLFVSLKDSPTQTRHGRSQFHSFDTSIMEIADDIAYGVHDFEDAIALGLVTHEDWNGIGATISKEWGTSVDLNDSQTIGKGLFRSSSSARKRMIGTLVNAFIVSVGITKSPSFKHPLLSYQASLDPNAKQLLERLMSLVVAKVIKTPQVQTLEYRGQQLIVQIYEALHSDAKRFLKESFRQQYETAQDSTSQARILCDYVAGMTDEYATRLFERLFVPRHGQFSDRL